MKKILLTVLAMLTVFSMRAQELNNRSILEMIELGFTDEVIIAKIKSSSCNFDTDINSLKSLKESGVSSDVIVAILEKQSPQTKGSRNGIYAEYNDSVIKIYPSSFSATKTRAFGLTSSMRSVMSGESSKNVLSSDFPVFYFYFSNSNKSLLGSSPNEYALVRLTSEKGKRSVKTGDFNAFYGSDIGIDEKSICNTLVEPIDEYTFQVKPETPLMPGEYCFFYKGTIPQGGYNTLSAFDFSIPDLYKNSVKFKIGEYVWIKSGIIPAKCKVINYRRTDNGMVYVLAYNNGITEERNETDCFKTRKEAKDSKNN